MRSDKTSLIRDPTGVRKRKKCLLITRDVQKSLWGGERSLDPECPQDVTYNRLSRIVCWSLFLQTNLSLSLR